MASSFRDNPAYEPLRRNDLPGPGAPSTPTPSSRQSDAGQPPLDRPTLGAPSATTPPVPPLPASAAQKVFAPTLEPNPYHTESFESNPAYDREVPSEHRLSDRKSMDSRTPFLNTKRSSVQTRPGSIMNQRYSEDVDDMEREQASYFENPPAQSPVPQQHSSQSHLQQQPSQSQFLAQRGRPMSFYDMKEHREQGRQPRPSQTVNNRQSWRSAEMPYNYADMIGGNRYNYSPPRMGDRAIKKESEPEAIPLRLPWTMWMNSGAKNMFVAGVGEWVGTTMFLFFAFAGTQVANAQSQTPAEATTTNATTGFDPQVMLYISLSFGFSLMVNVWIFFRISGGLFNPAVTLALWATGAIGVGRGIVLFISQIVGSITASALVLAIFPTPLNVRTTLSDGTSLAQGLFIEAFATAELVFAILMLAKEKHRATFIAPVGIGLALFVAELVGVYYTGGSLNPARSIGPCIVTNSYDSEHWIYWLGPAIGCLFAIGFYKFIKILEYEMANPGQDGDDLNDPTKNPNHEVREKQREMTARVLASLGFEHPNAAAQTAQQADAEQRLAEEGSFQRGRSTSVLGALPPPGSMVGPPPGSMIGEDERPYTNHNAALSTVASMSDANSPTKAYGQPHGMGRMSMQNDSRTSDSRLSVHDER